MEHLAYMNGERDADADFGPEESHLETATSAVGTTSLTSSTEPRPLARPPSPLPPLGKDACYLARKAAEAKKKRVAGKKKMTKRQEAELRREEKKAKDERGRAEHAAAARSAQKKNERERATLVEQRGRQTRDKAILQLSSKAPAKRKGTSKPGSRIAKRPKNASRQFADTEEDADADDKGAQGTQGSAENYLQLSEQRPNCHHIWHLRWKNGEERPHPRVGRDIQMRGLGKKRRRRAEGTEASEVADREEDEAVSAAAGKEEVASDQDRNDDSV
ncbi:hypothetical protein PC128_g16896 [Phytophthora cactorum]|nr:hypothetical protein PC128_g16896 [Phytophthora cactorum]